METTEPIVCPFCKGRDIIFVNTWTAGAYDDKDNTAELDEYQCHECEGRSFWC